MVKIHACLTSAVDGISFSGCLSSEERTHGFLLLSWFENLSDRTAEEEGPVTSTNQNQTVTLVQSNFID
jgi:hypothetical protein